MARVSASSRTRSASRAARRAELLSRELSADLELTSRFRALDEKLDAIHEGLEVMIVASRHHRETILEWIIIILISVEALIMLMGK